MKPLLLIYGLIAFFLSLPNGYTLLSPVEFYEIIYTDSNGIVFDARLYEDYSKSRIKDAVWVGKKDTLIRVLENIDKEQNIYLYCYEGTERGIAVIDILLKMGYKKIFFLKGGFDNWVKQGMEVDYSVFVQKII